MKFAFEDGRINLYVRPRHYVSGELDIILHEYIDGRWQIAECIEQTPLNLEYAQEWLDGADDSVMVPAVKGARIQYLEKGFEIMAALMNGQEIVMSDSMALEVTESFRNAMLEMLHSATFKMEAENETT